jgi:RHS repeat-associated protein
MIGIVVQPSAAARWSWRNGIGMCENGTQTWTLYDPATSDPIMDFNGSGSLTMRYLWGPTGIVARQTSGGTVSWYLADALGTVRDLINSSGAVIDHVDYSAFGTALDESSPTSGDRFVSFAGLERDTVTGLNLAVEREENPETGRWGSQDPLGFGAGDADLYAYAGNSPTAATDSSGDGPALPSPFPSKRNSRGNGDRTAGNIGALQTYWQQIIDYVNSLGPGAWSNENCLALMAIFMRMRKLYLGRLADGCDRDPVWYVVDVPGHRYRLEYERQMLGWLEGILTGHCGMPPGAYPLPLPPLRPPMLGGGSATQSAGGTQSLPAPMNPIFPAEPGMIFPEIEPETPGIPVNNPGDKRLNPLPIRIRPPIRISIPEPVGVGV